MAAGGQSGSAAPEYLTLRGSYTRLIAHVKTQTGEICDNLFEKGYISSTVRDYVRTDAIPDDAKARRLIDALVDKVEQEPSVYYGFIDILKGEPSADNIVKELEELFQVEQSKYEDPHHTVSGRLAIANYSVISFPKDEVCIMLSVALTVWCLGIAST